ncbi:3-hydroxyacyl-CoA dehydrogenase/enoyl-CoA hydratase family protein [Longirhabdus pacifica]|uniref:3-hydroxyacyl-CoA dehydrogenase/enoyl-CoA hydratase family protein n=1 Tax=Longirhabdus pacifica TaxID=2305227 RepID=UPI001008A325|nr:3-hydroxyacyl-CoA dehydrogenase/enoyl-CoA hydratase family protein [Longirhabdus pacifica]
MLKQRIQKAAVIGSGVMGASIAAHLAGCGIDCYLYDIVPNELNEKEKKAGLTLEDAKVRNRIVMQGIEGLKTLKPSPLFTKSVLDSITPLNLEDHTDKFSEVNWIIEVVTERLDIKQKVMEKIEKHWKPGIIVSSNTSGISINEIANNCSDELKSHFLGTHFFNPPRYMKLLEIIPNKLTKPEIIENMKWVGETQLGKGVVIAKDTPNFIANRIGTFGSTSALHSILENGYTVEDVDAVTGPLMGRPKSATFRTMDIVGLDTFLHVIKNVHDSLPDENEKQKFMEPQLLVNLVERGWIGQKSGQGFYKKVKTEKGKQILALRFDTFEYEEQKKVNSAVIQAAKQEKTVAGKIRTMVNGKDKYADLAWNGLKNTLLYAAEKLGEIADTIEDIDNAMKWGFNWELGPFEVWDAIGLKSSVSRMEEEGLTVPTWVKEWIAAGNETFYKKDAGKTFYFNKGEYTQAPEKENVISLQEAKAKHGTVLSNAGASLVDIGDGVVCLEFHSPNNAIGGDILMMVQQSVKEIEKNYKGMVIANEAKNFCVGANLVALLMDAQEEEWDDIDYTINLFQQSMLTLKKSKKPVVAAPHRMALGGGAEICLHSHQITRSSETYMGLVEAGVGLIPAGGGTKEMAVRMGQLANVKDVELQPYINKAFETIAMAKVSTSGAELKELGFIRKQDTLVMNQDQLIYQAKQNVLHMDQVGFIPEKESLHRVVGENGRAVLEAAIHQMLNGKYISEHDALIARKTAHILSGGDAPENALVSEQYLLDLEREAFLSLCGEVKTQQRIEYMLKNRKPLRN